MSWPESSTMEAKMKFIAAVLEEEESMTELCERFEVSRTTGYQLLRRYEREGVAAFQERSRAPHRVPWAIAPAQREAILALRDQHPHWGPKKLRVKLCGAAPDQHWPALSTIGDLLKRAGRIRARRRKRRAYPTPTGLTPALQPNGVWCIDFKGWWRTRDGTRCDPLTLTDAYSRFLLCAQLLDRCDYECSRHALERVFREYGLPTVIRSDNGPPFASVGAGGLSHLAVWWVKLGILPERIAPAQPQQNGRHERMHRTLKAECALPPARTRAAQQARLDAFRTEFNHQRPHEALGQTPPVQHYQPSPRPYPARLQDPVYPDDYDLRRVRHNGELRWQGELVFLSEALCGEVIGLSENQDGDQEVYFGPLHLGTIDVVALTLRRPAPVPKLRRGGRPSSRSSQKTQKV
jgi:putative transposase